MRLVENTPLLADEAAEVSTTKLMMPGCRRQAGQHEQLDERALAGTTSRQGVTAMMASSAHT